MCAFALKKSLGVELFDFFSKFDCAPPTKSAFVQRRQLIKAVFFQDFFLYTASVFYKRFTFKTWNGFRVFSIDGTASRVPNETPLVATFGAHSNQHSSVASSRWLILFDLLNQIILDVKLHKRQQGEITVAMPMIEHLPKDAMVVYDRGFASFAVFYLHQFYKTHCIIRIPTTFNHQVEHFVKSTDKQRIISIHPGERSVRALKILGHKVSRKTLYKIRLIRVHLPSGEVEVLMTTLFDCKKYNYRHFGLLYNCRWGIETSIFILKSFLQAAVFSSYTLPGVAQELWAVFAMYNLQSIFIIAQQKEIKAANSKRKYNYQINRNIAAGLIKRFFVFIFSNKIKAWYAKVKGLLKELFRHLEPIRPRESRERKRKILRGTERHIYESNYKPTL